MSFCDFLSGIKFELELALRENADFLTNENAETALVTKRK